jgi:hypothetical protein
VDWEAKLAWASAEHEARRARGPGKGTRPDLSLAGIGNASWAAGLTALMLRRPNEAQTHLVRAAEEYRESAAIAPSGSWGRPLASLRCRLLAEDRGGAVGDAEWTLEEGAADAESPIARYAAALALLTLDRDGEAESLAAGLRGSDDFPDDVAAALAALGARDAAAYDEAVRSVLRSFELRETYLEDVPVADTVLVLQSLATERGIEAALESPLLPGR